MSGAVFRPNLGPGMRTTLAVGGSAAGLMLTGCDGFAKHLEPRLAEVGHGTGATPVMVTFRRTDYVLKTATLVEDERERSWTVWCAAGLDDFEIMDSLFNGYRPVTT